MEDGTDVGMHVRRVRVNRETPPEAANRIRMGPARGLQGAPIDVQLDRL